MGDSEKFFDPLYLSIRDIIINKCLLPPGGGIVAGVSGGADSVCLLHILARYFNEIEDSKNGGRSERLVAVHVNHMLRGAESLRDKEFVEKLCASFGVRLVCASADVPGYAAIRKLSIEAAAREVRYDALERERLALEAATGRAWRVAVAHNKDDLAETVLMNILRGAGVDGLRGMGAEGDNKLEISGVCGDTLHKTAYVIRPLLRTGRVEIEAYLARNSVGFVVDSTNVDTSYTRNRLRGELLPLLRTRYNPAVVDALCRLSENAGRDSDYLEHEAAVAYADCLIDGDHPGPGEPPLLGGESRGCSGPIGSPLQGREVHDRPGPGGPPLQGREVHDHPGPIGPPLPGGESRGCSGTGVALALERFNALHAAIAARVVRLACSAAGCDIRKLGFIHISDAIKLAASGRTGAVLHFPGGFHIRKTYEKIVFESSAQSYANDSFEPRIPPGVESYRVPPGFVIKSLHKRDIEIVEQIRNIRYNSTEQLFDADVLCSDELVLRYRQSGDFFYPIKAPGEKKLKDFFIDAKIPREKRDSICLLAIGRDVVWVIGYRVSERYKVTDLTENILRVRYFSGYTG